MYFSHKIVKTDIIYMEICIYWYIKKLSKSNYSVSYYIKVYIRISYRNTYQYYWHPCQANYLY